MFFISILFSCYIVSSSNITSVYSMEHIRGVEKNNHIMSSRQLNLPLVIQEVRKFDDPLFFPAPIFLVQTSRYRTDKQ